MQRPCPYDVDHVRARSGGETIDPETTVSLKKNPAPANPKHPDRICWGCDKYCPADDLACGNGTIRTPHPVELFGEDWLEWADRKTVPVTPVR